jgi:hypothetical protein
MLQRLVQLEAARADLVLPEVPRATYSLRRGFALAGIADNVATAVFTVTTTNETGNTDGGGYYCHVRALAGHDVKNDTTNDVVMAYQGGFVRAQIGAGTGSNSAVLDLVNSTTLRAATLPFSRQIDSVAMTVVETSEYVQTVLFTVNLSGATITTAQVVVEVELLWYGFLTPPVLAAA